MQKQILEMKILQLISRAACELNRGSALTHQPCWTQPVFHLLSTSCFWHSLETTVLLVQIQVCSLRFPSFHADKYSGWTRLLFAASWLTSHSLHPPPEKLQEIRDLSLKGKKKVMASKWCKSRLPFFCSDESWQSHVEAATPLHWLF